MADIQSAAAEIGEEKRNKERNKERFIFGADEVQ